MRVERSSCPRAGSAGSAGEQEDLASLGFPGAQARSTPRDPRRRTFSGQLFHSMFNLFARVKGHILVPEGHCLLSTPSFFTSPSLRTFFMGSKAFPSATVSSLSACILRRNGKLQKFLDRQELFISMSTIPVHLTLKQKAGGRHDSLPG